MKLVNLHTFFGKALIASVLIFETYQPQAEGIPKYILDKAIALIEGAAWNASYGFVTRPGEVVVSAGAVEMDYSHALYRQWYANRKQPQKWTVKSGYLSDPERQNGGYDPLLNRYFAYYDLTYLGIDPQTRRYTGRNRRYVGKGYAVAVGQSSNFSAECETKAWRTKYAVHSNYSYKSGGQGLRRPADKFNLIIEYSLADLDYNAANGLVSTERRNTEGELIVEQKFEKVSKIQRQTVSNVNLLEINTEIVVGPAAYGECKRVWKRVWPDVTLLDLPPFGKLKDLIDKLINKSEWTVHEFPIDYGWEFDINED